MPVFVVLTAEEEEPIVKTLKGEFGDNWYQIWNHQWLVDANETAESLSKKLKENAGDSIFAVFKVDSHSGFHKKDMWDWFELPRDL